MNHSTDPMTPVRALIEAAEKVPPAPWTIGEGTLIHTPDMDTLEQDYTDQQRRDRRDFIVSARNAIPAISQLLSEHDKVVALQAEMRARAVADTQINHAVTRVSSVLDEYADRLAAIVEEKP